MLNEFKPVVEEPEDDLADKLDNLQIIEATEDELLYDKVKNVWEM